MRADSNQSVVSPRRGPGAGRWSAVGLLLALSVSAALAFPPYIPVADRFKESHVVVRGDIVHVETTRHARQNRIVRLRVKVRHIWKGKLKRKMLGLTFIAFPKSVESHLLKPLKKGSYILFLQRKKVTDARGRVGYALVFYEPRVYAYLEATAKNLKLVARIAGARPGMRR